MKAVTTDEGIGFLQSDEVVQVELPHPDVGAVLKEFGSLEIIANARVKRRFAIGECALRAPILRPGKIWGIGLNYRAKALLNGRDVPTSPVIFLKAPSAVIDPGSSIAIPSVASDYVDYEGEVAIVIGRQCAAVSEKESWDCVAGIMAANDVTARDVFANTGNPSIAKSFDTFSPLGASLASLDEVKDRENIAIATTLNGVQVQKSSTEDLIFSVTELIALLSTYATLEAGDVILTGTPPGTGSDLKRHLKAGDEVTVTVEGVEPLVTDVSSRIPTSSTSRGL